MDSGDFPPVPACREPCETFVFSINFQKYLIDSRNEKPGKPSTKPRYLFCQYNIVFSE